MPRINSVIIVASGPSAKGFEPPHDIPVIAVNGAIDWLTRADYWFTLDPSFTNMNRMRNPRAGVKYFCACPLAFDIPPHVKRLWRIQSKKKLGMVEGLAESADSINTGNSAYGALGLAKHMGFKKAFLIGVDATREEKCEGGFPNDLSHLPYLFESALSRGVEFATVRQISIHIPNYSIEEGLTWLRK